MINKRTRQAYHDENQRRAKVRITICPKCGAAVGARCIGSRGKLRIANHAERIKTKGAPDDQPR